MRSRLALLVLALALSACASLDSFNRAAADVTHQAIVASEDARCSVRPVPCLSDDQFKAVNVKLLEVSTAGRVYTELRIAGKSSASDVSTFLATVARVTADLSTTFRDGRIGAVLQELTKLQAKAAALLGD